MRKSVLIAVVLAILGIGASFFLIPDEKEESLIVFKEQIDSRYGEVEANYRARLDAGEVTPDVVSPLVKLYLESGSVDKAIVVMEKYVKAFPDKVDARKQLGTLYQYAQRPDDYLRNLEEMNALGGNKEILKSLSEIYNFNEDYEAQAQVLQKLVDDNEQLDSKQVVDLANILAANKKPDAAIESLYTLRKSAPEAFPFEGAELLASLLLDAGEAEKAYDVASEFSKKETTKPADTARLVNILHFKGSPEWAQKLLEPYGADVTKHRELLYEQVLLHLSFGRDDKAYSILNQLYADGRLPEELLDSYMILAIRNDNEKLVNELATHIQPETIGESQAISLIELASAPKRHRLLALIKERLGGSNYRQAHPLFSLVMGMSVDEKNMAARIEKYTNENELTDQQYMVLARACVRERMYKCADTYLERVMETEPMTHSKVASIGSLYIDMRRTKKGLAFVEKHRVTGAAIAVDRVWTKLAAANGRTDEVRAWMDAHPNQLSYPFMSDLYFLSADNRHYPLAVSVAERLYDKSATPETRSYLANSYIKLGRFQQALALLEQNSTLSADDADSYMSALIAQAARDPSYRRELGNFAARQLSRPLSERRKLAIVYALIDAGRTDIAMPYIREYALKRGGDWVSLYAENLERQGKHEQARDFWLKLATQPGISNEQKSSIAYNLLEKGFRSDAESLFVDLAKNEAPDSEVVAQLLYVWGPRLSGNQIEWLHQRAATSGGSDRTKWLGLLSDYAGDDAMISFVGAHPDVLNDGVVARTYLQALSDTGRKDDIKSYYNSLLSSDSDLSVEQLRHLARFAKVNDLPKLTEGTYRQLVKQSSTDQEALREIGIAAYSKADYSEAEAYLGEYLVQHKEHTVVDADAYQAYFYYAESLRRDKRSDEAAPYYQAVVDLIKATPMRTADMESKLYQSSLLNNSARHYVWDKDERPVAFDGYMQAAQQHVAVDETIEADLASTLVERKQYAEAWALLEQLSAKEQAVNAASIQPLHLPLTQGFKAYRLLNNRQEILLAGSPVNAEGQTFAEQVPLSHEWVSYVTQGYDKTLIVAKSDYELDAVRGQNGGLVVVPRKTSRNAVEVARQKHLRNELLTARVELETDKHDEALARLNSMYDAYPNDPQYLGYLANAENYVGRWPRALKLLRQAHELAPLNEDINELKHGIERQHAQHVKLDHEWRGLGDNDEQITTLSGFATVSDGVDIGIVAQNNNVETTQIRRSDGRLGQFEDDKQRGELFVRYTNDDGSEIKGSLFANNDTLGGGAYYSFINRLGKTTLSAEWHRPYWEFVEGVLDDATRDRLNVAHVARLTSRTTLNVNTGFNRYNVEDGENVASSVNATGSLAYQFADNPDMSVIYGFDGEYLTSKEVRQIGGTFYRPTSLRSREVHSLSLAGKHDFTRKTYLEWLGGYSYDRIGGGHGPLVEGRLTHEVTDEVEFQVRGSHGIGSGETDDDLTRVGAYLMYRY